MDTSQGTRLSRKLCLRYVLRHSVAFREYWTPKNYKRRFWHRFVFSPILTAFSQGDEILAAGRGSGKSFSVIEPELVRQAINRKSEETLLTTFRKTHIVDRMERVIDYFETIPFFRTFFYRKAIRSPVYNVQTKQGHQLYGISVGDDPEARMAQGKHASTIVIDEAHQYPMRAWMKLQGARDPRGSKTLMVGVPDGRLDTPFRMADREYRSFKGRRFHLSHRHDPLFDQTKKQDAIDKYGGENSDLFKQEVDAEWGSPAWSAWNLELIYACQDDEMLPMEPKSAGMWHAVVVEVSGNDWRAGLSTEQIGARLPGRKWLHLPVFLATDVGYSQPTEIGILQQFEGRWYLIARVRLTDRMEHDDASAILDFLGRFYGADKIGIDTTDGEGRAIARTLELIPRWAPKVRWDGYTTLPIVRVSFNESEPYFYSRDQETGEVVEVKDTLRQISTRELRERIAARTIIWSKDEALPTEFNQEIETKGADGVSRVMTPPTVHITDMLRVFAIMLFRQSPPVPLNALDSVDYQDIGSWSEEPSIWSGEERDMEFA